MSPKKRNRLAWLRQKTERVGPPLIDAIFMGMTFGYVARIIVPVIHINTRDLWTSRAVLLSGLAIGSLVGWRLSVRIRRRAGKRTPGVGTIFIIVNGAVQLVSIDLYYHSHLVLARVVALGGLFGFLGSKLLVLALIPLAKAIPAGFGGGVGVYLWNRISGRGRGEGRDKPRGTGEQ